MQNEIPALFRRACGGMDAIAPLGPQGSDTREERVFIPMMKALGSILGEVMYWCYALVQNYGLAIILFTLLTKIVLLPFSIWLHKNGIKIVKLQAKINTVKAEYYGDAGVIAEKQSELYKQEKYNPLVNLIPIMIQLILLMGLIEVIYHPLTYILHLDSDCIQQLVASAMSLRDITEAGASIQLSVVDLVKTGELQGALAMLPENMDTALRQIEGLRMDFLGINMCGIPSELGGLYVLSPLLAALSSWLLCMFQNAQNVLQSEQGLWNKYGTMLLSVGISLYLGWFVPIGVALYWVVSNLCAILQTMALNQIINPKKYVDYEELEQSRQRLRAIESLQPDAHTPEAKENARREKADYIKFFSIENKHLVFFSEKSGYYKYYQDMMAYVLTHSNVVIHYVTNDPNDQIFAIAKETPQIHPYYISMKKAITLFMKMDADMVVMTTPDLDNYYLKRSYVRKDIEYVYVPHGMASQILTIHKGGCDHFDTAFCAGQHHIDEMREMEEMYGTRKKNLVPVGYGLLDDLIAAYAQQEHGAHERPIVLIAPSWQKDNILDTCIDGLIRSLLAEGFRVVVRPHPEYVKRFRAQANALRERWAHVDAERLSMEMDFTSNVTIFTADTVVTDWSGIAYEFSFATLKKTLYIDTPMKVSNPDFYRCKTPPFDLNIRDRIGVRLKPEEVEKAGATVRAMLAGQRENEETLRAIRDESVFHIGHSGEYAGKYLLQRLLEGAKKQ